LTSGSSHSLESGLRERVRLEYEVDEEIAWVVGTRQGWWAYCTLRGHDRESKTIVVEKYSFSAPVTSNTRSSPQAITKKSLAAFANSTSESSCICVASRMQRHSTCASSHHKIHKRSGRKASHVKISPTCTAISIPSHTLLLPKLRSHLIQRHRHHSLHTPRIRHATLRIRINRPLMTVSILWKAYRWHRARLRHQQLNLRPTRTQESKHLVRPVLHENATMACHQFALGSGFVVSCVPVEEGRIEEAETCEAGVGSHRGLCICQRNVLFII
jgi:hypothetical protein